MDSSPEVTYFAETNYRNQRVRFGIKRPDRRRHMYIIGKTGTGKTTLLDNMTVQDIQRGNGVAVIDPHGEYAERMLSFVPQERIGDVVYFNPADTAHPIGFNMLEKPNPAMRHFVASGLMSVFKKLWVDAWSARMEYFLSNSILTHLESDDATLMGVHRIFGDKAYRKRMVAQVQDSVLKAFWENEFEKLPESFMREAVAAIQNKVGQFIANPLIRNVIGQPKSSFNLRDIMDGKKILIANLAKGRIGEENSKLLGAMLVTRIYLAAMSRVDMPEDEREDFYVYVDEFQNFATESFASILSEARKYHLNLTMANQYMAQLVDDKTKSAVLRDAILGNVGTLISFRIGAEDAEVLEKEFEPEFVIQDFVNLQFANIYLKLMIDNTSSRPFSAITLPPIPLPPQNYVSEIIEESRARYSRPVGEVESMLKEWGGFSPQLGIAPPQSANGGPRPMPPPASPQPQQGSSQSRLGETLAGEPRREREKKKKEEKMYPAVCAVDGAPIMVPFQPDGRRPVYCTEHLSQIQRGGDSRQPIGAPSAPKEKEVPPVTSRPVVHAPKNVKPMSLSELLPKDGGAPRKEEPRREEERAKQPPPKKPVDIAELRRVLQETVSDSPQDGRARNGSAVSAQEQNRQNEKGYSGQGSTPDSGVIKPGESVKFE